MTTDTTPSTAPDDGGPAFPSHGSMGEVICEGASLRDLFAAKAMQGFCSWPEYGLVAQDGRSWEENTAHHAYAVADAMLVARSKS